MLMIKDYAGGGTRTRTSLSGQGILSPLRLPFRHAGYAVTTKLLSWTWRTLPSFKMMCKAGPSEASPVLISSQQLPCSHKFSLNLRDQFDRARAQVQDVCAVLGAHLSSACRR
jgi:hypothetical protein